MSNDHKAQDRSAEADQFGRAQAIDTTRFSVNGWESFTASTKAHGEIESRCELRTPTQTLADGGTPFLDIHITEYVGVSRRAKMCGVRLQERALRKLYAILHAKFGDTAGTTS